MNDLRRLNRYTTLPILLDMLKRKRLVLLDPENWEDKNDYEILLEYKRRKGVQSLLALCFSYGDETIHDWNTFAFGTSGCCVEFNAQPLIALLKSIPNVQCRPVKYKKIKEVKVDSINVRDIPFTKRWPYRCESEFRVIWIGDTPQASYEIPIDLSMITKVTISQRMPEAVCKTIRTYLREAFANPDQRINRSTLFENTVWINKFKEA